jgi:molybdopterin adenylyltransferase
VSPRLVVRKGRRFRVRPNGEYPPSIAAKRWYLVFADVTEGAYDRRMTRAAKVLTVSDGVVAGTRVDRSGEALAGRLAAEGYEVVERRTVADGVDPVAGALTAMAAGFAGLVVTTGGTGFGPRDLTPEGTRQVLEREAAGLAEAMRLVNPAKGRLSRGLAGTVGECLVLNTPGSSAGAVECLEAVLDVLPHALDLLAGRPTDHG